MILEIFCFWQERWFQQTDKDLQQRREGWLHGAAGLRLCGAPHPVLPEQVSGPVQCQTGHTAAVPHIPTPAGELTVTSAKGEIFLVRRKHNFKGSPVCALVPTLMDASQQVVMEIDIDAVGQQLRMLQDQYKEKSKEYDLLYEKFNQTSQVWLFTLEHPRLCAFLGHRSRDRGNSPLSILSRTCRANGQP